MKLKKNQLNFQFPFPVDAPDNVTLVTTSTTLPWEQYGWGASTPNLVLKNNAFFCLGE